MWVLIKLYIDYKTHDTPPCLKIQNRFEMTQRLDAKGGNGGKEWDDGADYDGVTKIYVKIGIDERCRYDGINYIYFDYVKNGQPKYGSLHGLAGENFTTV